VAEGHGVETPGVTRVNEERRADGPTPRHPGGGRDPVRRSVDLTPHEPPGIPALYQAVEQVVGTTTVSKPLASPVSARALSRLLPTHVS